MTEREPYQALLDSALSDPERGADRLAAIPATELDALLRDLIREHREAALPLVTALAARAGAARRAARRALYRLEQSGVIAPSPSPRASVEQPAERPVRAWMSGIDGSGSRAAWVVFEDRYGGLDLCSVIINDVAGIMEAAGGAIARKRLERELAGLRESQKLPWVELPPGEVVARIAEALALHERLNTAPPAAFTRWRRHFPTGATTDQTTAAAPVSDPALAEHAAELLELPELAGWFLDPERVQADTVHLMEARASRLVVSDQIKAEREEAILAEAVDRELPGEVRDRWAWRLMEMARIFDATDRPRPGALARAAAADLLDHQRAPRHVPFARALARRALEIAAEVSSGRLSASDVSRQPRVAS